MAESLPDQHPGAVGPRLRLEVLGHWELTADGRRIGLGQREQRLLGLLTVRHSGSRSLVAGTLWPDSSEALALANLRSAVWKVQHQLPGIIDSGRVELALHPMVRCDVTALRTMIKTCQSDPAKITVDDLAMLAAPPLLPGWKDEWVLLERERIRNRQLAALQLVARERAAAASFGIAEMAAEAATRLEPLSEDTVELLITARDALGDTAGALQAYRQWERRLRQDLGLDPTPQMRALVPPVALDPPTTDR
ncbi:MAG TPA: BTAD domain-containing putative transcriptional regulator [Microlunatus sp.]